MSLLERCKDKAEGLQIRVMELEQPLTDDAAYANRNQKGLQGQQWTRRPYAGTVYH